MYLGKRRVHANNHHPAHPKVYVATGPLLWQVGYSAPYERRSSRKQNQKDHGCYWPGLCINTCMVMDTSVAVDNYISNQIKSNFICIAQSHKTHFASEGFTVCTVCYVICILLGVDSDPTPWRSGGEPVGRAIWTEHGAQCDQPWYPFWRTWTSSHLTHCLWYR